MSRIPAKGEIEEVDGPITPADYKRLLSVSESAMKSWERFTERLLTHVNPYTGIAWKDDPSIIFIAVVNEGTGTIMPPGKLKELFEKKFAAYAAEKGWQVTAENRKAYYHRFRQEVYLQTYHRMVSFIRNLGCRTPLTDINHRREFDVQQLRSEYDVIDNHGYWIHPVFLGSNWRLPALIDSQSALVQPGRGLPFELSFDRMFDKPFSVSEWDYVNPGVQVHEGGMLMGAYAALQDWGALMHFVAAQHVSRFEAKESPIMMFDTVNDPIRALGQLAGSCFYLRGDVAVSPEAFTLVLPSDYPGGDWRQVPAELRKLGLYGRTGILVVKPGETPAYPAGNRAVLGVDPEWRRAKPGVPLFPDGGKDDKILQKLIDSGALPAAAFAGKRYRSSTGELEVDEAKRTFKAVTPRSEGFILEAGKALAGKFAEVANRKAKAMILVASHDGKPLAESGRILILHLTHTKNTLMKFADEELTILEEWGKLPLLLERGEARITLAAKPGMKLYACRLNGSRLREIPLKKLPDGRFTFDAVNLQKGEAVMAYELVVSEE